jgi:hypothetical protein
MTKKLTSKIQHLLLIVVMLLNPILVSADVLFSDKNDSIYFSTITSSMASSMASSVSSDAEKYANCHDEMSADSIVNDEADCCEEPCECGTSSCHTTPATVSSYKSSFIVSTYSLNYLRDYYLSFVSSPSSPPPIA